MRIAVISDIHANAPALDAVLSHAAGRGASQVLCLGDVVGYHAMPHQTIERLRKRAVLSVAGNHDLAVTGALADAHAGPLARRAVAWTKGDLSADDMAFLQQLPSALRQMGRVLCLHAAVDDPERRLRSDADFRDQAHLVRERFPGVDICLTGHTHEQLAVSVDPAGVVMRAMQREARLPPGTITFVNPGSVGRPLDGDRRAAYATLDCLTNTVSFWRVVYDTSVIDMADAAAGLDDRAAAAAQLRSPWQTVVRMLHSLGTP